MPYTPQSRVSYPRPYRPPQRGTTRPGLSAEQASFLENVNRHMGFPFTSRNANPYTGTPNYFQQQFGGQQQQLMQQVADAYNPPSAQDTYARNVGFTMGRANQWADTYNRTKAVIDAWYNNPANRFRTDVPEEVRLAEITLKGAQSAVENIYRQAAAIPKPALTSGSMSPYGYSSGSTRPYTTTIGGNADAARKQLEIDIERRRIMQAYASRGMYDTPEMHQALSEAATLRAR